MEEIADKASLPGVLCKTQAQLEYRLMRLNLQCPGAKWAKWLVIHGFLPDFQVVHERRDTPADPLRLTVVPAMPLGLCSGCRRANDRNPSHLDSRPLKDLSVGPQAVELIVRNYQFHRVE